MAVDAEGNIHCCERIGGSFPIGHITLGIDWALVNTLVQNYITQICKQCNECSITRLCGYCYAAFCSQGGFQRDPANVCQLTRDNIMRSFGELWSMFERGVPKIAITRENGGSTDIC
jgi:uncharacterized protein